MEKSSRRTEGGKKKHTESCGGGDRTPNKTTNCVAFLLMQCRYRFPFLEHENIVTVIFLASLQDFHTVTHTHFHPRKKTESLNEINHENGAGARQCSDASVQALVASRSFFLSCFLMLSQCLIPWCFRIVLFPHVLFPHVLFPLVLFPLVPSCFLGGLLPDVSSV